LLYLYDMFLKIKSKAQILKELADEKTKKELIETVECGACFTHFMCNKPITFKKEDFYEDRYRRVTGYMCPKCGHLIKVD
jgi:ssDNA-binding Zn-finger/Zn-ribbon topoisomerase 1